jgi:hypothetical protein
VLNTVTESVLSDGEIQGLIRDKKAEVRAFSEYEGGVYHTTIIVGETSHHIRRSRPFGFCLDARFRVIVLA